jgi:hypothetical protein
MRVRIHNKPSGSFDGVDLAIFHPGHTYEVDRSVGSYLIVVGAAEPAESHDPGLVVRSNEILVSVAPKISPDVVSEFPDCARYDPDPDVA